jgi:cell wall-associated NlpC family hydrolase
MNPQTLMLQYALSFLGLPYIYGANNPIVGFDCSGLVVELLKSEGKFPLNKDASSATLFTYLKSKTWLSVQNPEFGDIIFYGKPQITHVAYFLGSGFIIESSGGDKNTNTPQKAASKNAFVKLRQYDYRDDIYAILREGNNVLSLKR